MAAWRLLSNASLAMRAFSAAARPVSSFGSSFLISVMVSAVEVLETFRKHLQSSVEALGFCHALFFLSNGEGFVALGLGLIQLGKVGEVGLGSAFLVAGLGKGTTLGVSEERMVGKPFTG